MADTGANWGAGGVGGRIQAKVAGELGGAGGKNALQLGGN